MLMKRHTQTTAPSGRQRHTLLESPLRFCSVTWSSKPAGCDPGLVHVPCRHRLRSQLPPAQEYPVAEVVAAVAAAAVYLGIAVPSSMPVLAGPCPVRDPVHPREEPPGRTIDSGHCCFCCCCCCCPCCLFLRVPGPFPDLGHHSCLSWACPTVAHGAFHDHGHLRDGPWDGNARLM